MRKIIHVDMDCFYAAIELREQPHLRGKPVAVGGRGRRGVLTTANYEAREFGVRSAMPVFKALELCPHLFILPTQFDRYRQESLKIREIFYEVTPLVEPLSLDEAFLDVSNVHGTATRIARRIRRRIYEETQLTASAGIGPNKLLAKIASDWRKPNGQFTVTPEDVESFLTELPVRKLWGVGPKAAEKLKTLGIETVGQLRELRLNELQRRFGSFGVELYQQARGIDDRPVKAHRERKSLSCERTFSENLAGFAVCADRMEPIFREMKSDLAAKSHDAPIKGLFVKVKFADFRTTTAERHTAEPSWLMAETLLGEALQRSDQAVRLIGVGVRFGFHEGQQLELELNHCSAAS